MKTEPNDNINTKIQGLTKREYFAIHTNIVMDLCDGKWLESVLGRSINFKNVQEHLDAQIEVYSIIRVAAADALIETLNR